MALDCQSCSGDFASLRYEKISWQRRAASAAAWVALACAGHGGVLAFGPVVGVGHRLVGGPGHAGRRFVGFRAVVVGSVCGWARRLPSGGYRRASVITGLGCRGGGCMLACRGCRAASQKFARVAAVAVAAAVGWSSGSMHDIPVQTLVRAFAWLRSVAMRVLARCRLCVVPRTNARLTTDLPVRCLR